MVFDLVRKERLLNNQVSYKYKFEKYLLFFLKLIFIGLFVTLECFIFLSLDSKVEEYSPYGFFDFLVLILFVMFIVSVINALFVTRKLLFNNQDSTILLPLPISAGEIIYSKLFYLFFEQVLLNLVISTPLLICYGATRLFIPYFYVFSIIYPILISFVVIGISLTLVVPFQYLYNFLKKHDLIQFLFACVLIILLCFLYQYVLNIFLIALNDSSFGGVFSPQFVNNLHNFVLYLFPISSLLNGVINSENILSGICIYLGIVIIFLIIGVNLSSYFYNKMNKLDYYQVSNKRLKNKDIKILNLNRILLKKEITILFKDSSNIFSYTGLLILMPFLSFVVINSLNLIIYDSLRVFSVYFPELTNGLNLVLILLFISVINANASLSISREEKGIQIIKYLPISPIKQILIKLIVPISLSSFSLILTEIILVSTKTITWYVFLVSLIIGLSLIIFSNIFGILVDMYDRNANNKRKLSYLNNLISICYPIFILIIHFILSFLKLNSYGIYFIEIGLTIVLMIPLFIKIRKKITDNFNKMEVN